MYLEEIKYLEDKVIEQKNLNIFKENKYKFLFVNAKDLNILKIFIPNLKKSKKIIISKLLYVHNPNSLVLSYKFEMSLYSFEIIYINRFFALL